jgi:integrase
MGEWLDSIATDKTHQLYEGRFKLFLAYINPALRNEMTAEQRAELQHATARELLQTRRKQIADPDTEPQMARLLKKFYIDLIKGRVPPARRLYAGKKPKMETRKLNREYAPKSAQAICNAVRQFFRYFGKAYAVDLRITEQQLKPRVTKRKYEFSTEELQRVLAIAGIRDKVLILLGCASGWSAGDIVNLKKDTIEKTLSDPEERYYWFTKRLKTNTDMYLCLTTEARQVLGHYIKTLPSDQTWLFQGYDKAGSKNGHINAGRLDYLIKDLAEKAGIRSRNSQLIPIRFHGLRQYFARKYKGRPEAREFCMGHVPRYEGAYSIGEQEIWEDFQTQDENLRIQKITSGETSKRVETLEEEVKRLKYEVETWKGRFEMKIEKGEIPVVPFDKYDPRKQKKKSA